ncbi:MAG: class I SAM-dependent RNA methyltransferase [Aquificaceae bacterium]|nr:class I SAM-dependent RNA methyltransferase [Aquificaceae bacterium]MCS7196256.1 class I SAM-dependent RNA methyltransferase [Aquificaceae bacterium]MCX7990150.1 class I SAM-dependent RNA methyltransferase [Aquificaceae bacterium]MDW8031953.1 class I SAM-dependent RNA methyltransferase [Aquificaceae bacterium]MDW8294554.1 class I SAM-dependent RNA methyltransferase [Aquificaceae bacterium]
MTSLKNLYIKKLLYGGYGFAQLEGKSLMVDYALPGELVEAEVYREKKDYSLAKATNILLPSSSRREAPCPYYGACGGCQLQHMEYGAQLKAKEEMLLETLERIGKLEVRNLESPLQGNEFGYRIKAQFKVFGGRLGFFERRSHKLVDVEECLLLHPSLNRLIPSLRELAKGIKNLREVHVLYSPHEGEFLLKLFCDEDIRKEKLRKLIERLLPEKVVGVGFYREGKVYSLGRNFTFLSISPYKYRVSMDSFLQVNYLLWERFIECAVPEGKYERTLELHCGIGFFSLFLARTSGFLTAYDNNRPALRDAEYNARINAVGNVSFECRISSEALKKHAGEVIDLLFLDPPRSGLSGGEASLILKNKPKVVVYVSCEPTTLARDLKVLVKGGYKLVSLRLVDNFPNTYHIETIAQLRLE